MANPNQPDQQKQPQNSNPRKARRIATSRVSNNPATAANRWTRTAIPASSRGRPSVRRRSADALTASRPAPFPASAPAGAG